MKLSKINEVRNSANSLFILCHPEILLPLQHDVTTSRLYNNVSSQYIILWYEKCFYRATVHENVTHMKWYILFLYFFSIADRVPLFNP